MVQRSSDPIWTGKRLKAWLYAEEIGFFFASEYLELPIPWNASEHKERHLRRVIAFQGKRLFPLSPNLRGAFRCGAWKWVEQQPVDF